MSGYLKWSLAAVVGLVLAAGLAFVSYELVSEPIGLSTEPVTAGEELAPQRDKRKPEDTRRTDEKRESTPPAAATDQTPPSVQNDEGFDDKGGDRKDQREDDRDSDDD